MTRGDEAGGTRPAGVAGAGAASTASDHLVAGPSSPLTESRLRVGREPTSRLSRAFIPLKWTSFCHSCIYLSLLICALALGKPEPATFVLGMTHGILWIGMSLACIAATRMRIVSLRLAVAVAVLGGIGPFFGSWEFVREERLRAARLQALDTKATDPYC